MNQACSTVLLDHVGKPCPYCATLMEGVGVRVPTRDHFMPRCRGGRLHPWNTQIACFTCNGDKDNLTPEAYWILLVRRGDLAAAMRLADLIRKVWIRMPYRAIGRLPPGVTSSPAEAARLMQRDHHRRRIVWAKLGLPVGRAWTLPGDTRPIMRVEA